jgi:hypothetical protein
MRNHGLRWGRIVLGGFLVEAVLMAITIPLFMWGGEALIPYLGVIGSLVATFLFGWWVARRAPSRHVLHGLMVGVVAMVIYGAIFVAAGRFAPPEAQGEPMPLIYYVLGHGFKLLGGAVGGLMVAREQRRRDDAGRARAVTARYGN